MYENMAANYETALYMEEKSPATIEKYVRIVKHMGSGGSSQFGAVNNNANSLRPAFWVDISTVEANE